MASIKSRVGLTGCLATGLTLVSLCGCQSWSGLGLPLQNAARVPAPGTGTYPAPSGYYNKTSSMPPSAQVMQASNNANAMGAATPQNAGFQSASVQTAGHSSNDFPSQPGNQSGVASASFTDYGSQEVPDLNWQP